MPQRSKTRSTLTALFKVTIYLPEVGKSGLPHSGQTVVMANSEQVGGTRRFLPAVEGMRACAAIGVVITHVAFDTGHSRGVDGRLFGRFDLLTGAPGTPWGQEQA